MMATACILLFQPKKQIRNKFQNIVQQQNNDRIYNELLSAYAFPFG